MVLVEQNIALENIIQELGYANLRSFAVRQAQEILLKKIKVCDNRIKDFEGKYALVYVDFCQKFHDLQVTVFEKEEDGMLWETEIALKNHYMSMLNTLIE